MNPFATLAVCALVAAAGAPRATAQSPADPAAIAEAYFDESERFDAFLTYESRRGPARMLFSVARRWRDGLAELLFDIREPTAFRKWALLAQQTRGGGDNLFAYLGEVTGRRVRRFSSANLEREAAFSLFAIGDFRPTPAGELHYAAAPDASVADTPCRIVIGRPAHAGHGFDRVELAFAADTGLLLESRFFRGELEFRRVSIAPRDYAVHDSRRLPIRRRAQSWPQREETELVLKSVLPAPELSDELFSHRNLIAQRFPNF